VIQDVQSWKRFDENRRRERRKERGRMRFLD